MSIELDPISDEEGILNHVIRINKAARGFSEIIFDVTFLHPLEGEYRGNFLTYVLTQDISPEAHEHVAKMLIKASQDIHNQQHPIESSVHGAVVDWSQKVAAHPHAVLSIIPEGQSIRPIGLETVMDKVGDPATLTTPNKEDLHGITQGDVSLQLYYRFNP